MIPVILGTCSMCGKIGSMRANCNCERMARELEYLRNSDAEFKNFHRLLCERFGYVHDPIDWKRDQISLIEYIASQTDISAYTPLARNWLGPGVTYPCGCRSIGTSNEPPWYCNEHNTESRPLAPDLGEKSAKHDAAVTDKAGERGLGYTVFCGVCNLPMTEIEPGKWEHTGECQAINPNAIDPVHARWHRR